MMGLRWPLLSEPQQKWLSDGSLEWLWPAAEQEGLPIAMMGGLFLNKFRDIAERHPRLKMIVDHCGLNRHGRDAEAFVNLDELVALAKLPNVAVKATGAPHYSTEAYPYRNIQDGCIESTMRSGRNASSGVPTSPACPAATGNASLFSPKSWHG
jgi:hypothetical protein